MENNRSYPDSYYNYGEYNEYQNYRNENFLPKESFLKASDENKPYYRGQENFQDGYSDDQLWNMEARRIPNSAYSMFPKSHTQNLNQPVTDSQMRNNLPQKRDLPLKGILVGGHNGNNSDGMHRNIISEQQGMIQERKEINPRRAKSPHSNYRLPSQRSNENLMATLCGGEPVLDMDDSQYYLINDRKLGQENYDNDKNLYDDYNEQTDDEISFKDGNTCGYHSMDNEVYESSLRDLATYNPRERVNKQFQKQMLGTSHGEKTELSAYGSSNNDYYMFQQRNSPSSSQGYNQTRVQNLNRNRNLLHPGNRQDMYKYKYQELLNDNSKRSLMMSQLNKYKLGNDNEQINKRFPFPMNKTQDASSNTKRKIQMYPDEMKFQNNPQGESGSFVHMHKDYQNSSSVPGCCVDVYNNYRKDKTPESALRTE